MVAKELSDYIKQAREQGVSNDQIRSVLLGAGWLAADINEVLAVLGGNAPSVVSATRDGAGKGVTSPSKPSAGQLPASDLRVSSLSGNGSGSKKKIIIFVLIGVVVAAAFGSVVFAYQNKVWFFAKKSICLEEF